MINTCYICRKALAPDQYAVCSLACSDHLVLIAKRNVRASRDANLIDQEEYYQVMRVLNLA